MTERLNSSLEAAGAEFLVLGNLLVEGIQAFKAYTNFPGYDIVATIPERNRSCLIQVKSRWATDYNRSFPLRNFDCNFVVLVALNRGFRYGKAKSGTLTGRKEPEFYVFPVEVVQRAQDPRSKWGIVHLRNVPNLQEYLGRWDLVRDFLSVTPAVTLEPDNSAP